MKSVCVYCGSNPGQNPAFVDAARHVGQLHVADAKIERADDVLHSDDRKRHPKQFKK